MIRRTLPVLACLVVLSCGSPPESKLPPPRQSVVVEPSARRNAGNLLESLELAEVEPGTYGPLSVSLAGGALAIWAAPGEAVRDFYAAVLDKQGKRKAPPFVVGQCPASLGLVQLKAVAGDSLAQLVYSVQTETQNTKLVSQLLDAEGHQKVPPVELVTTQAALLWMDVVDTSAGPIVFYATGQNNRAVLRAVGLGLNGAIRFADREVTAGLRAWQVAASPTGAVLGVVRGEEQGRGGKVELLLLDSQAAPMREAVQLSSAANAELDLDLVRVADHFVVAWSERSPIDARILMASVDASGKVVTKAAFATPALGEQALVKLVSSGTLGRAALVWEELNLPTDRRRISMMEIDELAQRTSDVASLPCSVQSSQLPEIVASPDGWGILTLDDGRPSAKGELGEPTPIYVELGPKLQPKAASVLRFAEPPEAIPLLAWGLDCRNGCRATVAFDGEKVQLRTALLSSVGSLEQSSLRAKSLTAAPDVTQALPRLEQLETLLEVEPLADFAVSHEAGKSHVAYLTYFDPAISLTQLNKSPPDGRKEPPQARLDVVTIAEPSLSSAPSTVSYRATSQPGVSMAAANETGERVLAWSALEQGSPQLFLSRIGADGKKLGQRMLTHRKGDLDDVTVVPSGDGYLAAWIDERSGSSAFYATRVTKTLERRGNEQRVSQGVGQVTALAVLPRNGYILSVWAEVRADAKKRRVELFARRLSLVDASPLAPPVRLLELTGAVRFLTATRYESGALLTFLEVMQEGNSVDEPGRVRFLRLDEQAQVAGATTGLSDAELAPVSVALDCPGKLCHGVVNLDLGGRGQLSAFVFDPTQAKVPELVPIVRSLGTVEQNVPPVLIGNHLFAVDQVDAERVRLQRATLRWE